MSNTEHDTITQPGSAADDTSALKSEPVDLNQLYTEIGNLGGIRCTKEEPTAKCSYQLCGKAITFKDSVVALDDFGEAYHTECFDGFRDYEGRRGRSAGKVLGLWNHGKWTVNPEYYALLKAGGGRCSYTSKTLGTPDSFWYFEVDRKKGEKREVYLWADQEESLKDMRTMLEKGYAPSNDEEAGSQNREMASTESDAEPPAPSDATWKKSLKARWETHKSENIMIASTFQYKEPRFPRRI